MEDFDISKRSLSNSAGLGTKSTMRRDRSFDTNLPRLQDLCPEDKAKIGDLVKKIAEANAGKA